MSSITILCKHGLKITICEDDLKNIPVLYQRYLNKLDKSKINLSVNFDYDIIIHIINFYSTGKINNLYKNDKNKLLSISQFALIYGCKDLQNPIFE